ncbi:hypothetical protein [Tabrizicola sp. BL-A-41-H6]|uniref:hypothetical protein n=1 Tax=Tabrizicola sp. BL-A-41-H6 TaxID=3421107 RepID=UPI003D67DF28
MCSACEFRAATVAVQDRFAHQDRTDQVAARFLAAHGLTLRRDGAQVLVVTPQGNTASALDLDGLWAAAERLTGRRIDPILADARA